MIMGAYHTFMTVAVHIFLNVSLMLKINIARLISSCVGPPGAVVTAAPLPLWFPAASVPAVWGGTEPCT